MKASNYNFFYQYDDESYLAYNSRSNSLAVMTIDNYHKYEDFISTGKEIEDDELLSQLKQGLFLINDDIDELKILRFKMYKDRMNSSGLGLTIAPTSDCNFRCIYCYEKNSLRQKVMTNDIEDAILKFVEYVSDTIKYLNISWYGGEPLMRFDIVERLSNRLIKLCDEKQIEYSASIITNGYLLNSDILKRMKECKINSIQITLDGPKEVHDKRRVLVNGKGTFEKIFENLIECKEDLPIVNLRINVDQTNKDSINYIYDTLKEYDLIGKVIPYLGHVKASNGCYGEDKCVSCNEFSSLTYDFQEYTNRGVRTFYPILRTNSCGADSLYSFVIDSDGELYKCWDDIGIKDKSVGNILDNSFINMTNINYMTIDPTLNSECSKCKYLPVCMGGCPVSFGKKENCTYFKYNLEKYLKHTANKLIEENKKQNSN